jgi:hypothetical protein
VRIDDERDLRERLDQAFETVDPHPAPVDDTVRRGRAMRVRRRVAAAAGVAAVAAIGAVAALGPSSLHRLVAPPPATRVNHHTVAVQAPGPDSPAGLIASGTVDGQRWWIIADRPGVDGAGAGQQDIIIAGSAVGAPGGADLFVPALSAAHAIDPVSFLATTGGAAQILVGAVRSDVSYVTVRLDDGTVLTLHPVAVYGTRAVAFAVPAAARITSATAYARHGQIATAIPFSQPGQVALFGAWLKPGQQGIARASAVIFSGRADGYRSRATAHLGPWGICVTFSGPSLLDCIPVTSTAPGTNVVFWKQDPLNYVVGTTSAASAAPATSATSVVRLVFTMPGERGIQVRPVRIGGQKLFAVAFRGTAKSLSWKAYDNSGAVVASGRVSALPGP